MTMDNGFDTSRRPRPENKKGQENPIWFDEVAALYKALWQTKSRRDRELGNKAVPKSYYGNIEVALNEGAGNSFASLMGSISPSLPDFLLVSKAEEMPILEISTGGSILTTLGGGIRPAKYYLPHQDSVLSINPFWGADDKYYPDGSNFVGIAELLDPSIKKPSGLTVHKLTRQPLLHDELSIREMETVVEQARKYANNDLDIEAFKKYEDEIEAAKQKMQIATDEAKNKFAAEIRNRTLAIVDALKKYPSVYNKIPRFIRGSVKHEFDENGKVVSKSRTYLDKQSGQLYDVPIKDRGIKFKIINVEREFEDFNSKRPSPLDRWLTQSFPFEISWRYFPKNVDSQLA